MMMTEFEEKVWLSAFNHFLTDIFLDAFEMPEDATADSVGFHAGGNATVFADAALEAHRQMRGLAKKSQEGAKKDE